MHIRTRWKAASLGAALLVALNGGARAAQKCDFAKPETTPSERFKVNQRDATTFDTATNLTWKLCPEGIAYSHGRCTGNAQFRWDDAVKNLHHGWRLPNVDELNSIVEKRCSDPAINLQVFPNTQPSFFWSASVFAGDVDYAHNIYFGRGLIGNDLKSNYFYVRLVRGRDWKDSRKNPNNRK